VIEELRITDLGVIREATISLHPGLTVVTGETGAGKTMIVTGIGLLLGARADPRSVRTNADRARVEGRFRVGRPELVGRVLAAGGELDDDELIVARHLTAAGRSRAYVGGTQVPAGICSEITGELIAVHGQSEQLRLVEADRQRELLDRFAGPELGADLLRYQNRYRTRQALAAELDRLSAEAQQRVREIDLLTFGLGEVERVTPEPGEDLALAAEALRLQAADDLRLAAQTALASVAGADDEPGGALSDVARARRAVEQAADQDPELAELGRRLAEVSYLLADVAADTARYVDGLDAEPDRLEWIAERRSALSGLTRKYGSSVDEVLAWAASAAERLVELEASDDRIATLTDRLGQLDAELAEDAAILSRHRRHGAAGFGAAVVSELAALAMPYARLNFVVSPAEPGPYGADQVDLQFSANPGSEPRSLAKVASGGELSRVRLALEVVLAGTGSGTLVFDEVDAGVGGKVAVEIGRRLARLARTTQVVVVTHLAQVAAFADRHYVVVKSDDGEVTTSGVVAVADGDRAAELARMMAGLETTESALAHAGELVELAVADRAPG